MSDAGKYEILLRILDAICQEATGSKWEKQYRIDSPVPEEVIRARSKAFIHLYIKVMFGLSEFSDRESYVTDGSADGGIDGYYIDHDDRRIYLIQSKFRANEKNFENKEIGVDELLAMDIDRITGGKTSDINGISYNGKIQGMMNRISGIYNIGRYNYHVVILANCSLPPEKIRKFTDGHPPTVFNFERSYAELVFPVITGTYYRAHEVTISLDLSNKSAGAKTSYSVATPAYNCEITVLFVPTLEIAKAMNKYRNTILEYNPRSYLELEGQSVNKSIRNTLTAEDSNVFALMNNGITILSDQTSLQERIGVENKAQLHLVKPQIINGGQTAYTLSRIYGEDVAGAEARFAGKEVLTKIITLTEKDAAKDTAGERLRLIEEISTASNRQTPVSSADRISNHSMYVKLQSMLFERHGVLLERKRGEFNDGVMSKYVSEIDVLERNLFFRLFYAVQGKLNAAAQKQIFIKHRLTLDKLFDPQSMARFSDGYRIFRGLRLSGNRRELGERNRYRISLAQTYIGVACTDLAESTEARVRQIGDLWQNLVLQAAQQRLSFRPFARDPRTGQVQGTFSLDRWLASHSFELDVHQFVKHGTLSLQGKSTSEVVADEFGSMLDETFPHGEPPPEGR